MSTLKRERWSRRYGEWFRNVLIEAGIMDYRYPIKGCGVWMPYGFKIRKDVFQILRDLLDTTGHNETLFPLMIPETSLAKESVHVKSFEEECFWVTKGGLTPLKVKYALRPTSETVIAPMLKLWIRSHADLPMKLYQIVSIFRYETKATRPLIRMREVASFKEAHTSHATREDAEAQVREAVEVYKRFFNAIGVPYSISRRPDWDKFAGAIYTLSFDMITPDGRTLQIGTVHNLGQNFSKAFDITFETEKGMQEHVWQTCYGISGRAIAAVLSAHGDDNGVVLPPNIAPIQVIVVPIPYKKKERQINQACERIAATLMEVDLKVELDLRADLTPGSKFYYWELRGVPLRIEVGPKDLENNEARIIRRHTLEKQTCKINGLAATVQKLIDKITVDMQQRAWQWMKDRIHRVDSLEEAKQLLRKRAGIVEVLWCSHAECGHQLEEAVDARVLGVPVDTEEKVSGKCIVCGRRAENVVRVAIAY
ncbi:MAG: proline--tRNA ligase [Candidatus Bathyarchaeota archaeon]|nr:MAG: proline--tRNA ligase [Candidatus Bathyarchaeota archaeon]